MAIKKVNISDMLKYEDLKSEYEKKSKTLLDSLLTRMRVECAKHFEHQAFNSEINNNTIEIKYKKNTLITIECTEKPTQWIINVKLYDIINNKYNLNINTIEKINMVKEKQHFVSVLDEKIFNLKKDLSEINNVIRSDEYYILVDGSDIKNDNTKSFDSFTKLLDFLF